MNCFFFFYSKSILKWSVLFKFPLLSAIVRERSGCRDVEFVVTDDKTLTGLECSLFSTDSALMLHLILKTENNVPNSHIKVRAISGVI